jgi:glycylpeptide N-tetradecanoyltransferase
MAPVLIWELSRRVRVSGVYRAIFTGSGVPARPFAASLYHHRPLNLRKMSDCGYYPVAPNKMDIARRRFQLPALVHGNCRAMLDADVEGITDLLKATSSKFQFDVDWTPDLVRHLFLPREQILYTYVILGAGGVSAFFCFYVMNWGMVNDDQKWDIRAGYLYYMASRGVDEKALISDLLNLSVNDAKIDVITALGIGGTHDALIANRFEEGKKALQFYSYNYAVTPMEDSNLRFIFV